MRGIEVDQLPSWPYANATRPDTKRGNDGEHPEFSSRQSSPVSARHRRQSSTRSRN
ncbi:uncharacterized protein TRAVEDRAFT_32059 [Trametes versicolor FP-101664 SS1]|uniref:uncharacterized protein n=1 Tax=Trametes versicolor (strain FP-101664) TaxID=717944 RepID=UPI00046246A3|nr:uncharacterized protein TRAVEDRAFT_32059 [Trametes versicolor FP-101664 SS1]EIW52290.1 hypothetical protein TRAVEDRAFT_32059 [Trametes versicolor FP-101664 SS1]